MSRLIALTVLLLIAALAGCVQSEDPPETENEPEPGDPDPGEGLLTGTILTVHLDPVENADVQLVQDGALVAHSPTDEQGEYTIDGVEPGDYVLQVSAPCCHESVQGVTISDDEGTSASLQLEILSDDDLQTPRVEKREWRGFLACTVRGVAVGLNVCTAVDAAGELAGQENTTDDDFLHVWTIGEGLKSVVGAMHWQAPGAALGDSLRLLMEVDGRWNVPPRYLTAEGTSPLEFRVDAGYVTANYDEEDSSGHDIHQYDFDNVEDSQDLAFRIFSGGTANVVYQQQFTVYWDLYYWQPAPDDATAGPDA